MAGTVSTESQDSIEPTQHPRKKWTRKRRRIVFTLGALIIVLAGTAVWGRIAFVRIEARARHLAEAGTSLNTFLSSYVSALQQRDLDKLLELHDESYSSTHEGPWTWVQHSDRDDVQTYAWVIENPHSYSKLDIRDQASDLLARIDSIEEGKFRLSSIEQLSDDDGTAVVRGLLWLRGSNVDRETVDRKTVEIRTAFRLWIRSQEPQKWRITKKELLHGQTVIGNGRGFANITEAAGIKFQAVKNPMLKEAEWHPTRFEIMNYATAGVTAIDYDDDGWCDIFFGDGERPRLYRNRQNGTFEDVTASSGLPSRLCGASFGLFADFDNDGDKDLFIGRSTGNNLLFRANGDGTFTDVTESANVGGVWVATGAVGDYDNDGRLDIYLGRYLDPRTNLPSTNFYTRNSEGNSLLRNEGDLKFRDVTDEAGVREGGLTLGIAWADYDKDGDQDIYVANDFGRNALLRNNGDGTFSDVCQETGTVDIGYGMSSTFADIDNDCDLDLYIANVHSGQRWFGNAATFQRYFVTSIQERTILDDWPLYRELHEMVDGDWKGFGESVIGGNTLLINNGDGTFSDVTESTHTNPLGWYWSSHVFDFDNDGLQDIYSVNGWITGKIKDDL